jgi:hypothetical protein
MKNIFLAALACSALAACATPAPTDGEGEKLARENGGYAPTGTFIKRKDGTGLGGTLIGSVSKQEAENARAMFSSGQGARSGF